MNAQMAPRSTLRAPWRARIAVVTIRTVANRSWRSGLVQDLFWFSLQPPCACVTFGVSSLTDRRGPSQRGDRVQESATAAQEREQQRVRALLDDAARCRTLDPTAVASVRVGCPGAGPHQFAAGARSRGAVPPRIDRPPAWPLRVRVRARDRGGRAGGAQRGQPDPRLVAPPDRRGPLPGEQLPRCARALPAGAAGVPGDRPRRRRGSDPAHRCCDLPVDGRLRPGDLDLRDGVGRQRGAVSARRRCDGAREPRADPRSPR